MPHKDPEAARRYHRERGRRQRAANPERFRKSSKKYYDKNKAAIRAKHDPRKHRDYWLRNQYDLSLEAWEAMFAGQGSCCAICRTTDPNSKKGWSTDHDHETGRVRGILCMSCNTLLGLLGDTFARATPLVARLLEYLQ